MYRMATLDRTGGRASTPNLRLCFMRLSAEQMHLKNKMQPCGGTSKIHRFKIAGLIGAEFPRYVFNWPLP